MRRPFTYANVAATLALVFSMSGGALAAKHYLINSINQINPKVVKILKGKSGPPGAPGAPGVAGKEGTPGKEGGTGKEGAAGSAVAYAHVRGKSEPAAMLDLANSKNVSSVTEGQPGLYCITTTVPVKNISGSVDINHVTESGSTVTGNFDVVALAIAVKVCPSSTTAIVDTTNGSKPAATDFWVTFE